MADLIFGNYRVVNQNCMYEEIKSRLNSVNDTIWFRIQYIVFPFAVSNMIKLCRTRSSSILCKCEHRLKMFMNRVLRRIFWAKQEVTGDRSKWHNELCDLYSVPDIIWGGYEDVLANWKAYRVLIRKPEGQRQDRWGIILKWIIQKYNGWVWFVWQ